MYSVSTVLALFASSTAPSFASAKDARRNFRGQGVGGERALQGGGPPPGEGGGGSITCSSTVAPDFGSNPSIGTCVTTFEEGNSYTYPDVSSVLSAGVSSSDLCQAEG
jgi:hypothetical protein